MKSICGKTKEHDKDRSFLISYISLQRSLGILGMSLPIVLIIGSLIFNCCQQFQPSISHYYYTVMGNYFVGTLCAFGLFLLMYKGYDRIDNIIGNIAGLCAILVAFFPTKCYASSQCEFFIFQDRVPVDLIHYIAATILFCCFAIFSLCLFTKSNAKVEAHSAKEKRNIIYRVCGYIILICIIFIASYQLIICESLRKQLECYRPTLIFESFALIAFGLSWLVKGNTIYRDK